MWNDNKFYDTKIEFLVSDNSIQLSAIIIGTAWIPQHEANLNFKNKIVNIYTLFSLYVAG